MEKGRVENLIGGRACFGESREMKGMLVDVKYIFEDFWGCCHSFCKSIIVYYTWTYYISYVDM